MASSATKFRVCWKTPKQHFLSEGVMMSHQEQIKELPLIEDYCVEILQMSNFPDKLCFSNNGFIHTVINAYNGHHNLIIRPDDIWAAIMTQFSFYINNHSEEFRGNFVDFKGKKELQISMPGESLRTAPYDLLVKAMTKEIDMNLVDPAFKNWILPGFSTTADNDLVTVGIIFMAAMKKYFDYSFSFKCGIPWVTLEGTVEDWENIEKRLEKLKEYNLDCWYDMLKQILVQFVKAKKGKADADFWQRIVRWEEPNGSGDCHISGWITAFCVFDSDGNWQDSEPSQGCCGGPKLPKKWLRLSTKCIPSGIVEVNVKIFDVEGTGHDSVILAGHMGEEVKSAGDTIQPTLGWAIALKVDSESK